MNYARSKFSHQNSSKEFQWKSVCGLIKKLEIMWQRKYYCYASSRSFSSVLCRQILIGPTLCTIQLHARYHSYFYVSAFTLVLFLHLFFPFLIQIILIDFGASREYSKEFVDNYIKVIEGAAKGDRKQVLDYSQILGFLTGYESKV